MLKKKILQIYNFCAEYPLTYPLLFKVLEKGAYVEPIFDKIIQSYAQKKKDFSFIQIGANDGKKFDPIFLYVKRYGWSGIVVEPVPYVFEKLQKNYRKIHSVHCEASAIGEKNGSSFFYTLRKNEKDVLPLWYDEIGSFIKENVVKHKDRIPDIEKRIYAQKIKVMTLASLFKKYCFSSLDYLQIDTEGYDYYLLKQIPSLSFKPKIIVYKTRHLSSEKKDECKRILTKEGYIVKEGVDTLAYLPEILK